MRVFAWVFVPFLCSNLAYSSLESIENQTLSELANSTESLPDDASSFRNASAVVWKKYINLSHKDKERVKQHKNRALKFGDKTMKFSLEKIGKPGDEGYPVYIALHGGGGAPPNVNDSQWKHMQIYYKSSVKSGIYIAPRGVTDTWNLHFVDESYPLYDRLIENLIAFEGADPNRIYLLGFSAGGDGVYQITPRMPDRWAAANMSAGHSNGVTFDNLLNTPFLIQVGERDNMYNRNRVAAENWLQLQNLHNKYSGYISQAFIHTNGGHNGWGDNDEAGWARLVIKNPEAWLKNNDRTSYSTDTNAVHWLDKWVRNSHPTKLIWDLSTRANRPQSWAAHYLDKESPLRATRDLFYWLAVDAQDLTTGRLEVEQFPESNTIKILKAEGVRDFTVLVHKGDFNFKENIKVVMNDKIIKEVKPETQMSVLTRTMMERGDVNFIYHMEIPIHLENLNENVEEEVSSKDFSYCSDGSCRFMSAKKFQLLRQFPLDMNYACKKENQYALTFDDGPTANVDRLLAILDRHQVKATFFVVGGNLTTPEGKAGVRKIHARGHEISNHTMTHRSLTELGSAAVLREVQDTQNLLLEILGNDSGVKRDSSIVRPPYGNMSQSVQDLFKANGFSSVRWNADRYDWKSKPTDTGLIRDRYLQQLNFIDANSANYNFNHSILDLNHEFADATLSVLDEMIPKIKAKGYEFVTVAECIE